MAELGVGEQGGRNRDGVGAQLSKAGAARGTTEAKATTVT